jgi:hypothetical protein
VADYRAAKAPDHQAAAFSTDCASCHGIVGWSGAKFDHSTARFQLTGAHRTATCESCHADKVYRGKSTVCASCHQTDYDKAASPAHAPTFPVTCADCHQTATWRGASFDHAITRFALTGAHAAVSCDGCHADKVYRGKSTECAACHRGNFDRTTTPPHAATGFPTTCESCHSTTTWAGAVFDHAATRFPLTGAHKPVSCASCHGDGVYRGKSLDCVACHKADYDRAARPTHTSVFPTTCATCHTTVAWAGATFDHATTQFPLTGAHLAVMCTSCHGDGVYRGKPIDCVACHQTKYNQTTNPPHAAAGFASASCATCHTTTSWLGAVFDHGTTRFPLTGAHRAVTCTSCHGDGVYRGKSLDCVACHRAKYDATTNPPHVAAGFPTTCEVCHTTTAWPGAVFNHSATRFPLTGAHLTLNCNACHGDGVYRGKAMDCVACHQAKYNQTTNPPHVAAGFPSTCATCHSTASWLGAVFDHNLTLFPLTGAHRAVMCTSCHGDGVYKGKSLECVACHRTKYDATTNPPHAAAGFPTTCATCHTTTDWLSAVFDHNATRFPLTGAHRTTACAGCHGDGVYRGKTTDCYACHQSKYAATTNPNHTAAMFPTTCASCHTTTDWTGATFNHDAAWFPIYSGSHRGRWTTCAQCHTSPTNFALFTCLTCHTKSSTDAQHAGRAGYKYDSQACYACHPRGSS